MDRRQIESIFNRTPITKWSHVHPMFGDVFFDLDGNRIARGQPLKNNGRLPAVLDNNRKVVGDLIPDSSWGSNLANLLTKTSWDKLRNPIIERNNFVCELCGQQHTQLDVHEVWSYDFPSDEDIRTCPKGCTVYGTQKIKGLIAICKLCHLCFHLGFANVQDKLPQTLNRLAALNAWQPHETAIYHKAVMSRFKEASSFGWLLDLSAIQHPDGGFAVKSPWKLFEADPRFITSENDYGGQNVTAILGAHWKFAREADWRKPIQFSDLDG